MQNWQLQEAKAKLSHLVERAAAGEAQVITKHGIQTAVLLSHTEYMRLQKRDKSALEAMSGAPKGELVVRRLNAPIKPVRLGG
jgi:prevent-host-death family protein